MAMNKIRSDQNKEARRRSIKKQHTENTRNYVKNPKQKRKKKHEVARKSTIIERLQGDEEERPNSHSLQ